MVCTVNIYLPYGAQRAVFHMIAAWEIIGELICNPHLEIDVFPEFANSVLFGRECIPCCHLYIITCILGSLK